MTQDIQLSAPHCDYTLESHTLLKMAVPDQPPRGSDLMGQESPGEDKLAIQVEGRTHCQIVIALEYVGFLPTAMFFVWLCFFVLLDFR
jgi:hypothetical protein